VRGTLHQRRRRHYTCLSL